MLLHDPIQLLRDLRELLVQVKRLHRDLITTHLVHIIRHQIFIGFCVEAHAGNLMSGAFQLCFLVLHICENLIHVAGMQLAIIDSPLSSFSESEYKQEQDTVTRGFTEYLLGERLKTQVIIAEHSQNIYHLEELPKDKINIIEFTEDESHGRYGFIPGLTNEIISGR